ncbi:hypothetical protein GCM10009689_29130 [Brevibacterium antiquum]|uniref:glycosyltransferase family 4 protein n=1 Tax=Brevibacterium antiquum TaxID=234835 RepID=UPI0018DFE782|nr:glycosyltransferase family 4 protein [Brevibacterium antiquum]
MSLGNRLQSGRKFDAAYLAFTNSVELDPGNFGALEPFIAMASSRGEYERIDAVLAPLSGAISGRPHRFLESLNYSIAYGLDDAVEVVAEESGGFPASIARMYLQRDESASQELSPIEHTSAQAVYRLGIGNWYDAIESIRGLPDEWIPVSSLRLAIRRAKLLGDVVVVDDMVGEYLRVKPEDSWAKNLRNVPSKLADLELLKREYPFGDKSASAIGRDVAKNRVAYTVYNSLPYHSAGYATRTQGLLQALRNLGWDVSGTTRLEYPIDMPGYRDPSIVSAIDSVEGVPYHRLVSSGAPLPRQPLEEYAKQYSERLKKFLIDERVAIVHAASNHLNGLASISAAVDLGIPSIYEVRGLWEITRASRDPVWGSGPMFRLAAKLEVEVASRATEVIAITSGLKSELVRRGVAADKITVVPNGVDVARFHPIRRDERLAETLDVGDRTVIGYVGSVVDYEGLAMLVEAAAELSTERDDFLILIVGDGKDLGSLKQLAVDLGAEQCTNFVGRVPHSEVQDYFSLIDIAPFPRLPLPVCEMVSPLKPFEAMAMGKVVVCSDVEALAEIIQDNVTGLLHRKGDVASLTSTLRRLLDDPELGLSLATCARRWVQDHRTWIDAAAAVGEIYERLGGVRQSGALGDPRLNC